MIPMNGNRRGFTLMELLVVVGMIAVILGAITTSVSSAQQRARVQKATSDVKIITQAILGYENYESSHQLPTMVDAEADSTHLGFLIGDGGASGAGDRIPALLMASLQNGGVMRDPWGKPYLISIRGNKAGTGSMSFSNLNTGYYLPNVYRLSEEERTLWQ